MSARREALDVAQADEGLRSLLDLAKRSLDEDPGHDLEHCLRVAGWAIRCGEGSIDAREAIAAALLHDIVNVPKNDPRRAEASVLSAQRAREILPAHGFAAEAIDRVAEAIEDHSYSRGAIPRSMLGRALQDADRLEALGVIGLFRTISTGARMGAQYFCAEDPWARARPLDDKRYSIDHFFTKLSKIPSSMQTEVGRAEAERRAAFLRATIEALGDELGDHSS